MNLLIRGLVLTAVQGLIVFSLAAKYQMDREKLPREWMKAVPYDPNLPIRGRYVRLRLLDGVGVTEKERMKADSLLAGILKK